MVLTRVSEPQTAQDHEIVIGDKPGRLDQCRFHVAPGLIERVDFAILAAPRFEQLDFVALLLPRPAQPVSECSDHRH